MSACIIEFNKFVVFDVALKTGKHVIFKYVRTRSDCNLLKVTE